MRGLAVAIVLTLVVVACDAGTPAAAPTAVASPTTASSPSPSPGADGPVGGETSPSPSAAPSPRPSRRPVLVRWTDAPSGRLSVPDDTLPVELSPDGTNLLVSAADPDGLGCEEGPPRSLQLLAIDSGALAPALDPGLGVNRVVRRGDGTVVLTAGCEGFIGAVWVATEQPDGSFTDVTEVPLPFEPDSFDVPTAVAPVPGSTDLVLVGSFDGEPGVLRIAQDGTALAGHDPVPQEAYDVVVARDGGVFGTLFLDGRGEVTELGSGIGVPGYDAIGATPDGARVLFAGDAGLAVLTHEAEAGVTTEVWLSDPLDEVTFTTPTPAPDGLAFVVRDPFGLGELLLVGPDGIVETIDVGVSGFDLVATDAAEQRLVYVRVAGDGGLTVAVRDRL